MTLPAGSIPQEIQAGIDSNERYRVRARSVATLVAAAAGALAAGLVISPPASWPVLSRLLGVSGIVLLVLATGAFVVASLVHARTSKDQKRHPIRAFFRPWETRYESGLVGDVGVTRTQLDSMLRRIFLFMNLGLWAAGLAGLCIVAGLIFATTFSNEPVAVHVATSGDMPVIQACEDLPDSFPGHVAREYLLASAVVPVTIDGEMCGGTASGQLTVYLDRQSITLFEGVDG
ncbi:hypothetical protein ACFCVO_07960 [Agromyces sp. NPDC056379]|uniref:hypothetical protein n=1 Tax=unclassified Agromyces TaxID=2639701 RepID=UPI0035DE0066